MEIKSTVRILTLIGGALLGIAIRQVLAAESDLQTVPKVDLQRYAGRWYEIARYPNRFERKCDRDITAEYAIRSDGKLSVVNSCIQQDGTRKTATGWAKIVDQDTNAKLKVTFFWPFFGDYWVIDLGQEYEYAVVSEPRRRYLWILSRTPTMSDAQFTHIAQQLATRGYDPAKLIRVKHSSK